MDDGTRRQWLAPVVPPTTKFCERERAPGGASACGRWEGSFPLRAFCVRNTTTVEWVAVNENGAAALGRLQSVGRPHARTCNGFGRPKVLAQRGRGSEQGAVAQSRRGREDASEGDSQTGCTRPAPTKQDLVAGTPVAEMR